MTRVKRGVMTKKRHKNVLEAAKGYRWGRKNLFTKAKEAVIKAGTYARRDRRSKKRSFRRLWITRLNTALRLSGIKYREFIALEKTKNIALDRKVLSQMAVENPDVFKKFVESAK
ncbi:MAG: 50S ribosomal protein L20 [Candidatus Moranbacteria bacterium RIFCSPHIGHO2_12_FULL_54_9]|nr:MAG: 50S ribosomal protein L20 [Candidatus Moranbacteria bacterium RIFCSPHIGHO2_01_FULL_54_31]OGI25464.1 MAG: 50S ribosomal protein L20 [Candidatus Moranbacteria bacterium RIFCSPHIGHO2_12_FULL_54_9]